MSEQMPLERMIAGWMADEAVGAPQQALDRILATTSRARPRPRWWAVLAEPTMRSRTAPVAVGLANRRLVLVVVLALLAVALAAAVAGASLLLNRQPTETAADWPGYRGSADHAGVGVQGPLGNPVLAWQFHAAGSVLDVAIVGDRVFFAGG